MSYQREAVENRIRELFESHGKITPDIVIEDAKNPDSPLHDQFEWDVNKAAMEAWRDTARRLIRSVRVVVTFEDVQFKGKGRPQPVFVRDPGSTNREQGYARAAELRSDRDRAMAALMYEIDRADSAIKRAQDVAVALGLSDEVRFVSSAIETVRRKAGGAA